MGSDSEWNTTARVRNREGDGSKTNHGCFETKHGCFKTKHGRFKTEHRWFEMKHRCSKTKHRWFEMKHRCFKTKHRWFKNEASMLQNEASMGSKRMARIDACAKPVWQLQRVLGTRIGLAVLITTIVILASARNAQETRRRRSVDRGDRESARLMRSRNHLITWNSPRSYCAIAG